MERVEIGGVFFDPLTMAAAVSAVLALAARRERPAPFVVTPNVDHVMRLATSPELKALYAEAALSLADGMPVLWAARAKGTPLPERVTGADLMPALCAGAAERGLKVYILGGPPGTADLAAQQLVARLPQLQVACYCPPFGFERDEAENRRIIESINRVAPDILFVGVGSPKQELWIGKHRAQLDVGVALGVGAAIEFLAGTLGRAPVWMQKSGTEWVYRMLSDPKRLVRRYAGNAGFIKIMASELAKGRRSRGGGEAA